MLSWPPTEPHGSIAALGTGGGDGNVEGDGECSATPLRPLRLSLPSAIRGVTPTIHQHTFVFARPVSQARAVGGEGSRGTGSLCVGEHGELWPRKKQQGSFTEQQRPGMTLAYHSSALGSGPASGNWTRPRQELPIHGSSQSAKGNDSIEKRPTERESEGLRDLPACDTRPLTRSSACERQTPASEVSTILPIGFGYSLGTPFHGQRVVSARFIPGDAAMKTPGSSLADLRLVTGKPTSATSMAPLIFSVPPHRLCGLCCI